MNKIEIKSAVKDLAEKFHVYDRAPFEGCQTFSHTFNGRTVELTLEKDKKILDFIVNNFGLIEKDASYKFKFCDAPKKTYNYAKISFAPTSNEDWISGEELRVFLKTVFKCGILAQISITNLDFGKFVSLDHVYAKTCFPTVAGELGSEAKSFNMVDGTARTSKIPGVFLITDVVDRFHDCLKEELDITSCEISDLTKQRKLEAYENRMVNRKTATQAGKILSQLQS